MANYMLVGAKSLGCQIFEVKDGVMTLNFDKEVIRKLWDYYYVPYIKGYFSFLPDVSAATTSKPAISLPMSAPLQVPPSSRIRSQLTIQRDMRLP